MAIAKHYFYNKRKMSYSTELIREFELKWVKVLKKGIKKPIIAITVDCFENDSKIPKARIEKRRMEVINNPANIYLFNVNNRKH